MKHSMLFLVLLFLYEGAFSQDKKFTTDASVASINVVKPLSATDMKALSGPGVADVHPVKNTVVAAAKTPVGPAPAAVKKTTLAAPAVAAAHPVKPATIVDKKTVAVAAHPAITTARVVGKPAVPVAAVAHPAQPPIAAHQLVSVLPLAAAPVPAKKASAPVAAVAQPVKIAPVARPVAVAPVAAKKAVAAPVVAAHPPVATVPVKKIVAVAPVAVAHPAPAVAAVKTTAIVPAAAVVIHPIHPAKPVAVVAEKKAIVKVALAPKPIVTLDRLMRLPLLDAKYSTKEYEYKLVPEKIGGLKEGDIVTTEGYVHIVAAEKPLVGGNNGDYQLQLTMRSERGDSCFIIAIPFAATAKDSSYTKIRTHIREALLAGQEPSVGGKMLYHAVYVRVTGRLYYDAYHATEMRGANPVYKGKNARLSSKIKSYTPWEIHPVSHIEFIDKE